MNILAFDTSLNACSAAAAADAGAPGSRSAHLCEPCTSGHAERLIPMIAAAVAQAGLTPGEVELLAVTIGPGTFAGVRTGVAAARALAFALNVPVVAATSLAVMARKAVEVLGADCTRALLVAVPARPGFFYAQVFTGDGLETGRPPLLLAGKDAVRLSPGPLRLVGPGAHGIAAVMRAHGTDAVALLPDLFPDARTLLLMAPGLRPLEGPPVPLYLREADAKVPSAAAVARLPSPEGKTLPPP